MAADETSRFRTSGTMAGVPVIRGTRVPLVTLVEYFENGRGLTSFLADHPEVTRAQADGALAMGLRALIELRERVPNLPAPATPDAAAHPADGGEPG